MLRFLTAGESHGKALVGIIEGIPYGLLLQPSVIDKELCRRQKGYGRGGRMNIESDRVQILSGVRGGITLGSPIALLIENKDWENWQDTMAIDGSVQAEPLRLPRPGHSDLAGCLKYGTSDVRDILERASARETAMRVALGAVARQLLSPFGVRVGSHVVSIGGFSVADSDRCWDTILDRADNSPLRCMDPCVEQHMIEHIKAAAHEGDTVGGIFEVFVLGVPPGLGSHVHWDRRLDSSLARAVMSIQGIKGVEIGAGFGAAERNGSQVHDEIYYDNGCYVRKTNNAGGIEGGITNGEVVFLRAAMKPIPTLMRPLASVDMETKQPVSAAKERSDVCAVPAASIVAEAMVAIGIAEAFLEKFGGDSVEEISVRYALYKDYLKRV
jgi:chorismate synthase